MAFPDWQQGTSKSLKKPKKKKRTTKKKKKKNHGGGGPAQELSRKDRKKE